MLKIELESLREKLTNCDLNTIQSQILHFFSTFATTQYMSQLHLIVYAHHLCPFFHCRADAQCGRLWCLHRNEKPMLLGWRVTQNRADPNTQRTCAGLLYDPQGSTMTAQPRHRRRRHDDQQPLQEPFIDGVSGGRYTPSTWQDAGVVPDGSSCSLGVSICIRLQPCF